VAKSNSPFPSSQGHALVLNIVARRLTDADREFQAYLEQERRMDRTTTRTTPTARLFGSHQFRTPKAPIASIKIRALPVTPGSPFVIFEPNFCGL
jgi:hypothetical protein